MLDFTFLTEHECYQLDVLKKCGLSAEITDFSILLGGYVPKRNENNTNIGVWITKGVLYGLDYEAKVMEECSFADFLDRTFSARPAIAYSKIVNKISNIKVSDGIIEVEYGWYPQTVLNFEDSLLLEEELKLGNLKTTGKTYTTDSTFYFNRWSGFTSAEYIEYAYEGNKYVRFIANENSEGGALSDGRKIKKGEAYWVKVEPIVWLVDKDADIALSKKLLFSGIQYSNNQHFNDTFENSDIKKYLDTYFSQDIIPSKVNYEEKETNDTRKINPYNFDYENVSEEDIIRGMVESNIAVFLHGKSSDGKSARVKRLDPDCEIIYLVNATPDSLNGKTVFNSSTNEMIDIPPTWYIKLKERCESEPDKLHIVFFDELTNAVPSIQSMAFNIVLNKEVNGKWKLPDNARIVAAGNEYEESRAANEMVEPLFNRFAHVYINTTVESWLKWASTAIESYERLDYKEDSVPMKIHPSIYAYIAYKSYSREDVLRTPYDGKTPNADPRKWEMSSKVLYKTNNPEMLRSLIGESLTKDFVMFTKRKVITVEDVINGAYSESDLEMSVSEKYNTAVGLSSVSMEHIEVVRDFVKRLGPEICATFDTLWTHGNNERLEKLMELNINEKTK